MPPRALLILFLAFLARSGAVVMNISPRLAFVGETVTIRCEIPDGIKYDIARIHHDDTVFYAAVHVPASCESGQPHPVIRQTFAKKVVQSNANNSTVEISFVAQVSNSGKYICRFIWGLNEYTSSEQRLVVGAPAEVEKLVVTPKHGAVLIGTQPMKVACVGSLGIPAGRLWILDQDNQTLPVETERVSNEVGKAFIKITATMPAPMNSNSETYTCRAQNVFTTNRTDTVVNGKIVETVTIFHTPNHVVISPDVEEAKNGDVFTCHARGNPKPDYKWIVNTTGIIDTVHGEKLELNVTGDSVLTCVAINHIAGAAFTGRRNLWLNSKNVTNQEVFLVHRNKTKFLLDDITTLAPTTTQATTPEPTTTIPTTLLPSTTVPSTETPTTTAPSTEAPTTTVPSTAAPTTTPEITTEMKTTPEVITTITEDKTKTDEVSGKEEERKQGTNPPIRPTDWHRNSSENLRPSHRRSAEERHYDTLLFYLKVSLAANVIFGSLLLIFLIGVCVRLAGITAK